MSKPLHNKIPQAWLLAGMLVLVMGAVYGSVYSFEFLDWDDGKHIVDNRRVNPPSADGLRLTWQKPYWGLYVPLSYTFFSVEAAIARQPAAEGPGSEANPAVFHLGNLALHIGCVLLVFALLRRLFTNDLAAFGGALLFGLHPLQVESVAWISETRGLLCAFFSLLAIFDYVRWRDPNCDSPAHKYYASATLALLAALLCKPVAVAVPLVVGVLAIGLLRQKLSSAAIALTPWFVIALVFVVITKHLQPDEQIATVAPYWARPLLVGDALTFYLCKLVAPLWLVTDYGRTPTIVMSGWTMYVAFLVPLALVAGLSFLKSRRIWLVCLGIFACWLLPVLGLIPFKYQQISTVADRYVYLSMLGPALALGWYLSRPRSRAALGIVAAVLCLLAGLSFQQTSHWRNTRTLLANVLAVNPKSVVGQQLTGYLLAQEGKHAEALKWYRQAMLNHPDHEVLHLNTVVSLAALGHDDEALAAARRAVERIPRNPLLQWKLAELLARRGEVKAGVERYEKALQIDPDCALAHLALGKLLQNDGQWDAAADHYRGAIASDPFFVQAYVNLGTVFEHEGKLYEAADCYLAALKIQPDWTVALFNLGNVSRLQSGGLQRAEAYYRAALKSDAGYVPAHVNLAEVLWRQGKLDDARHHYREILRLVPPESPYAHGANEALKKLDAHQ
jgi:tetratricopeptide (TPR) repeat protein